MDRNLMSSHMRQTNNCCDWSRDSFKHKYVLLCIICGCLSSLVGSLLLIVYSIMRSNTSSLQYFETIPTYIPAIILVFNGLVVMSFSKSSTRVAFLIKTIGGLYLVCALLCVVITVTTTVIHMNRLQGHQECVYSSNFKTCTCIAAIVKPEQKQYNFANEFRFEDIVDCETVHGILFACLRAFFGLSVFSILICIFTLMLCYQLLSHEKKKKYLQQLEQRRRFHSHNRGFPYASNHVSPHVMGHNRNHPMMTTQYCNCSDEALQNGWPLQPHSRESLDYLSLSRNLGTESQTGGNTANSWTHCLNWQRNSLTSNETSNYNINRSMNNGILNYILRRNNNDNSDRECNVLIPNTFHWRAMNPYHYLPPHVFIPRIGSGGLPTQPMPFQRFRDNNHNSRGNLLTAISSAYRRTRSNDGIFQHLNVSLPHNHMSFPNPTNTDMFTLWGPPPPYSCSQPQSLNRINTISNNITQRVLEHHRRESSVHSSEANQTSKMSTPVSERRIRCNAFSSHGIRLTIEGNDNSLIPDSKSSCIVEIHVPYDDEQHKNDIQVLEELEHCQKKLNSSFNTLPNIKKNEHLQQTNHFKSLSNISFPFTNRFDSNHYYVGSDLESIKPKIQTLNITHNPEIKSSLSSLTQNSTSMSSTEESSELISNKTLSSTSNSSFAVDPPTDYKSTLIIHTPNTQSSPITDKSSAAERQDINEMKGQSFKLNSTQSMPNLSCIIPLSISKSNTSTQSQPHFWDIHRIPSSGNTSTSQDFADFEFELDEEPIKFIGDSPKQNLKNHNLTDNLSLIKSESETSSLTPEFIQPPTPFNNQNEQSTSSTATLSSVSDHKPEIIINIKSIPV